MRYLILLTLLSGCSTLVPVKASFPTAPETLMEKCPPLEKLQQDAKLSDIAKNISENYARYHECAVKSEAWQEWYVNQKKIFDEVK